MENINKYPRVLFFIRLYRQTIVSLKRDGGILNYFSHFWLWLLGISLRIVYVKGY